VVFLGDSHTVGYSSPNNFPDAFCGSSYGACSSWLNQGIGGQGSATIAARFAADVLAYSPRYVVILCGTNDVASDAPSVYVTNVKGMIDTALANGIVAVVVSIPPRTYTSDGGTLNKAYDARNAALSAEIATTYAGQPVLWVDVRSLLGQERPEGAGNTDPVLPNLWDMQPELDSGDHVHYTAAALLTLGQYLAQQVLASDHVESGRPAAARPTSLRGVLR
jgi:lysophospholipase L1-like esterase